MSLSHTPLSVLYQGFEKAFGQDQWSHLEPETISLHLGHPFDALMLDKVMVLQVMENDPNVFTEDIGFTLHATEVINNQVADFKSVPHVTSLELAYAITENDKILISKGVTPTYTDGFKKAIAYLLREEGFSEPVYPFGFIPKTMLVAGQTKEDSVAKELGIRKYIEGMNNGINDRN